MFAADLTSDDREHVDQRPLDMNKKERDVEGDW
jgi:hypothetical protein